MHTPKKVLNKYINPGHNFDSILALQAYIRRYGTLDYIGLNNVLYTMEEYDMGGQSIIYANRRNSTQIEIRTQNRYAKGFGDATAEVSEAFSWRNDISYAD